MNLISFTPRLGRDISVYSGTHGVLEFPDVNNNHQQIYLYNKTYIPAPLFYWKVLQDKVMMIQHGIQGKQRKQEKLINFRARTLQQPSLV